MEFLDLRIDTKNLNPSVAGISAFQSLEALVFTDESGKYPEWPSSPNSNLRGQTNFKMSKDPTNSSNKSPRKTRPVEIYQSRLNEESSESKSTESETIVEPVESVRIPALSPRDSIEGKRKLNALSKINNAMKSHQKSTDYDEEDLPRSNIPSPTPSKPRQSVIPQKLKEDQNNLAITDNSKSNGISSLLSQAEQLLNQVKKSVKGSTMPGNKTSSSPKSENMDSELTKRILNTDNFKSRKSFDVDLLLRGLPEGFDEDDPVIDDELIERLLSQGGSPPSQLEFPSIYAANQRLMNKLHNCNELEITVTHLTISSALYGIRRDSTQILIRPPLSGTSHSINTRVLTLPLPELKPTIDQLAMSEKSSRTTQTKKPLFSLRDFFSGSIDLHRVLSLDVKLTDEVIQDWLAARSVEQSCIRIELQSLLYPLEAISKLSSKSKSRGILEPIRFGYVDVPLAGLLGTESLDAIVTCVLQADASTLAMVSDRMSSVPLGTQRHRVQSLTSSMGNITLRISLKSKDAPNSKIKSSLESKVNEPVRAPIPMNEISPVTPDNLVPKSLDPDPIEEALNFVPSEPKIHADKVSSRKRESVFLGIVIHALSLNSDVQQLSQCQLIIRYKDFAKKSHELSVNVIESMLGNSSALQVNYSQIHSWISEGYDWSKPFIFEIWKSVNSGNDKKLIGIAKFPPTNNLNEIEWLPISSIISSSCAGRLAVSIHIATDLDIISREINSSQTIHRLLSEKYDKTIISSTAIEPTLPSSESNNALALKADKHFENIDNTKVNGEESTKISKSTIIAPNVQSVENSFQVELERNTPDSPISAIQNEISSEPLVVVETSSVRDTLQEPNTPILPHEDIPVHIQPPNISYTIHAIDLQIDSRCVSITSLPNSSQSILGCQVFYCLPESLLVSSTSPAVPGQAILSTGAVDTDRPSKLWYNLWWDGDCSVLNGRQSHRLRLADNESLTGQLLGNQNALEFIIIPAVDSDPTQLDSATIFGTSFIGNESLQDLLSLPGCYRSLSLPLSWTTANTSISALQYLPKHLSINISHRIEPRLMHSVDLPMFLEKPITSPVDNDYPSIIDSNQQANDTKDVLESHLSDLKSEAKVDNVQSQLKLRIQIQELNNLNLSRSQHSQSLYLAVRTASSSEDAANMNRSYASPHYEFTSAHQIISEAQLTVHGLFRIPFNEDRSIDIPLPEHSTQTKSILREKYIIVSIMMRTLWDPFPSRESVDTGFRIGDTAIGSAVVDLSSLALGMPYLEGWYHILDQLQDPIGQIMLRVNVVNAIPPDQISTSIDRIEEPLISQSQVGHLEEEMSMEDSFSQLRSILVSLETTRQTLANKYDNESSDGIIRTAEDLTFNYQEKNLESISSSVSEVYSSDSTNLSYASLEESDIPEMKDLQSEVAVRFDVDDENIEDEDEYNDDMWDPLPNNSHTSENELTMLKTDIISVKDPMSPAGQDLSIQEGLFDSESSSVFSENNNEDLISDLLADSEIHSPRPVILSSTNEMSHSIASDDYPTFPSSSDESTSSSAIDFVTIFDSSSDLRAFRSPASTKSQSLGPSAAVNPLVYSSPPSVVDTDEPSSNDLLHGDDSSSDDYSSSFDEASGDHSRNSGMEDVGDGIARRDVSGDRPAYHESNLETKGIESNSSECELNQADATSVSAPVSAMNDSDSGCGSIDQTHSNELEESITEPIAPDNSSEIIDNPDTLQTVMSIQLCENDQSRDEQLTTDNVPDNPVVESEGSSDRSSCDSPSTSHFTSEVDDDSYDQDAFPQEDHVSEESSIIGVTYESLIREAKSMGIRTPPDLSDQIPCAESPPQSDQRLVSEVEKPVVSPTTQRIRALVDAAVEERMSALLTPGPKDFVRILLPQPRPDLQHTKTSDTNPQSTAVGIVPPMIPQNNSKAMLYKRVDVQVQRLRDEALARQQQRRPTLDEWRSLRIHSSQRKFLDEETARISDIMIRK